MRAEFPPFAVLQHRFRGLEGLAGTGEEGVPCRSVLTDRPFKFPILARWYIKQLREGISGVLPLEGSPIRDDSAGRGWVTAFTLVDGR